MKKLFLIAVAMIGFCFAANAQGPATVCPDGTKAKENKDGARVASGWYDSKGNQCNTSTTTETSGQNNFNANVKADAATPLKTNKIEGGVGYNYVGEKTETTTQSRDKDCQHIEVHYDCLGQSTRKKAN